MTFKGTLFDFQETAVRRMIKRRKLLLALGLGLGKTVTSIAAIERLIDSGEVESVLILCPASIKWQWARQIKKFTDGALVKIIEGPRPARISQYRAIKRGDTEYVIMNYEQVVNDWDYVRHLPFDAIVADEVVAIKSAGAKRSRHVKRLRAPYQFGLTGQPIENRPEDLYSIMEWIDPDVLGPPNIFEKTFIVRDSYGNVKRYRNLRTLRKRLGDAMFRKTRHDEDVKAQMPQVIEKVYPIEFDPAGRRLYNQIASELVHVIETIPKFTTFNIWDHYAGVEEGSAQGQIMARLLALRMLCDHPRLMQYSAMQFDDETVKAGSEYMSELKQAGLLGKVTGTPKLTETLRIIEEVLSEDPKNKVVLFSFFKPMLEIISSKLKVNHEVFNGDMTARDRDAAIERFSNDPDCRVFLSSDAGGIGVDLPVANYLISYDLPWSAGKWEQRNGRILRISSEWPEVTLVSMIMQDSIEERMLDQLIEKSAVAAAWLDGKGVNKHGEFELTLGTLKDFLLGL